MVADIERPLFKISGSAPDQSLFFKKGADGCFCHVTLLQKMRIIDELQKIKIGLTSY